MTSTEKTGRRRDWRVAWRPSGIETYPADAVLDVIARVLNGSVEVVVELQRPNQHRP